MDSVYKLADMRIKWLLHLAESAESGCAAGLSVLQLIDVQQTVQLYSNLLNMKWSSKSKTATIQ